LILQNDIHEKNILIDEEGNIVLTDYRCYKYNNRDILYSAHLILHLIQLNLNIDGDTEDLLKIIKYNIFKKEL